MGREVRKVPADWQHPKDSDGDYIPLLQGDFAKALAEYREEAEMWRAGKVKDWETDGWKDRDPEYAAMSFEEWQGGPEPTADEYMPDWPAEQRTHLMMYEDTTEGTPISPAFETPEELARWLADTGASAFSSMPATYEHWLHVCRGGWAPSAVFDGARMMSGVEGFAPPPSTAAADER